jgi:hypothetical protein
VSSNRPAHNSIYPVIPQNCEVMQTLACFKPGFPGEILHILQLPGYPKLPAKRFAAKILRLPFNVSDFSV